MSPPSEPGSSSGGCDEVWSQNRSCFEPKGRNRNDHQSTYCNPEDFIEELEVRPRTATFQNDELLAKDEILA